jgi:hypothetical protein
MLTISIANKEDAKLREVLFKLSDRGGNEIEIDKSSLILQSANKISKAMGTTGVYATGGALCVQLFAPPLDAR